MLWKVLDKRYYGCRYAKNATPADVLSGKYQTSSKYVKKFWEKYGPPDCIVIHRVFDSVKECRDFETEYLIRTNAARSDKWLNMSDNKSIAPECSGGSNAVVYSHASRKLHFETDQEFAEHIRSLAAKNLMSVDAMVKRKQTFKERNHQQGEKNNRFGVTVKGTETANRISSTRKLQVDQNQKAAKRLNEKSFICEQCGKSNLAVGNYKRWHGVNCQNVTVLGLHSIHDDPHETQDLIESP
jgi:hypothetical protein